MSELFEVSQTQTGSTSVIALSGDIDREAVGKLEAAYDDAAATGARHVVLDFTKVDYINSTGIAVVVGLLARARRDGLPLTACGLSDHYRELFEITRISDFIDIVPDLNAALTASAPGGSA